MKKTISFIIKFSLITLLTVFFFIHRSVFADGMLIKTDPYSDRWDYSNESNQQAYINYDNGLQKMIISIGIEGGISNGIVWLFPIPSDPNKVAIDVVKSLPQLRGEEISKKSNSNLSGINKFLQLTQIYTLPFVRLFEDDYPKSLGTAGMNATFANLGGQNLEQDVIVYEHLDKEGITSEIVTAKTANGLYNYLKGKGLKIESGSIPVLSNYIGKDYSFIISWIIPAKNNSFDLEELEKYLADFLNGNIYSPKLQTLINNYENLYLGFKEVRTRIGDHQSGERFEYLQQNPDIKKRILDSLSAEIKNNPYIIDDNLMLRLKIEKPSSSVSNQKGIFVTFPTKDIYFPLLPTSVYGSKTVPAIIRVFGHVSPKIFQAIESFTKTEYYIDSYVNFGEDLKNFYKGQNKNTKYTKIEINAPSKFLTDDLWINKQAPIKTYYSTFVAEQPLIFGIILFLLSSIIAGILAGMIIFRDLRKNPVKLGLIGLSNCLTLYGLLITTILIGTKNKNQSIDSLLDVIKQKGYFWKRKVATIMFLSAILFLVFCLFGLSSLFIKISYFGIINIMSDFVIPILIIYVLPISALIISFVIKRIKIEDKNLFEQLKLAGYSSWTFQPKDNMKYVFVPFFSILFLIISWFLLKIVELTV